MISDDIRKILLLDWLENDLLFNVISCEPASSDASFRRYFRITLPEQQQYVVMDAPPEKENIPAFIHVARLLSQSDVHVPAIYHENLENGFLVLEDFGSQPYLEQLNSTTVNSLYDAALDCLYRWQSDIEVNNCNLPAYDEALLQRELGIFDEWFIEKRLDRTLPTALRQSVKATLIESALAQPKCVVHRDYHSRNLMILNQKSPGVLDFQDAVVGPVTYDLVSLLRDCYIAWPQNQIDGWLSEYYQRLADNKLVQCDLTIFTRWFDLMGMQRHLKAIGIFSRLDIRDGKSGYLNDIPRTMNYVIEQARKYPELNAFGEYLTAHIPNQFKAS